MKRFRAIARKILPRIAVEAYYGYRESKVMALNRRMNTEDVFTRIYSNNSWGGGSSMTVVDLGCGDFSVGRRIAPECGRYVGVDIVKPLIDHNRKIFGSSSVSFVHANMVTDDLPDGDICFVRQVFQHLSNDQTLAVLPKLDRYRCSFVTEHQPSETHLGRPNVDKPHGAGIRARQRSGVFLDQPPFNFPSARYQLLLEVPGPLLRPGVDPGVIRTFALSGARHSVH